MTLYIAIVAMCTGLYNSLYDTVYNSYDQFTHCSLVGLIFSTLAIDNLQVIGMIGNKMFKQIMTRM